jgi:hypothetical protein
MVNGSTRLVPISEITVGTRRVDPSDELVLTARSLGIAFGDEAPGAFARYSAREPSALTVRGIVTSAGRGMVVPVEPRRE